MNIDKHNFVGFDLTLKQKKLFDCRSGQVVAILCTAESQNIVKEEDGNPIAAVIIGKLYRSIDTGESRIFSSGIKRRELFYYKDFKDTYVDTDINKLDTDIVHYKIGHFVNIALDCIGRKTEAVEAEVTGILINHYEGKLQIEYRLEFSDGIVIATQEELEDIAIKSENA